MAASLDDLRPPRHLGCCAWVSRPNDLVWDHLQVLVRILVRLNLLSAGRSLITGETPKFTAFADTGVSEFCGRTSELNLVGKLAWLAFGCVEAGFDGLFLARLACVIGKIKSIGSNKVTAMIVIFLTCFFILVLQMK